MLRDIAKARPNCRVVEWQFCASDWWSSERAPVGLVGARPSVGVGDAPDPCKAPFWAKSDVASSRPTGEQAVLAIRQGPRILSPNPMGVREVVIKTPALAGLSPEALDRLIATARTRSVERGGYLWHAGDSADALTIIRSGLVKVVKLGPQGRRSICGLFGAPDTVGDAALLRGIPYPADALVATATGTFIEIPRNALLAAIEQEPRLGMSCAQAVQNKLTALLDKIDVLSAGAVEARLATLLLNLYERFGDDLEDDTCIIPVVLARQELADLVSTTFETAIRVMTRWEREGVVDTTSSGFVIKNRGLLEKILGREPAS